MWQFLLFFVIIIINNVQEIKCNELDDLTRNFFDNLEVHLKDEYAISTTDASIAFMDKQVGNFVDLLRKRDHAEDSRKKRQVVDISNSRNYEMHLLEGLSPLQRISVTSPKDIRLFQQEENSRKTWYAAVLQENDKLCILKHDGKDFVQLHQRKVQQGVRLGLFTTSTKGTFIVVAENTTKFQDYEEKTAVYLFNLKEDLQKIQNLHLDYASDVAIWSDKGQLFMAIAQFSSSSKNLICSTKSTIYKWLGGHFDIIQTIDTSCAVRITPFAIGKNNFIAIANREDNNRNKETFSEIFKYDLATEEFISYQKILTRGAADIKFFAFRQQETRLQENFLVVANSYPETLQRHRTKSIVYKYVDGYFLPFQSFDLIGVTEWLAVIGPRGQFVLIAACRFEGAKMFQYNGWKFLPSNYQYTHESLAYGIQAMHSYNFNNKTIIVVANNDHDNEDALNMFELDFKLVDQVQEHYSNMLTWCKLTVDELVLVDELHDVDDKNAGKKSKRNVEAINLRSIEADLSNNQNTEKDLAFLELQLENLAVQLETISKKMMNATEKDALQVFPGDIFVRNVIINNEVFFNNLVAESLNGLRVVDFLSGIVHIDNNRALKLSQLDLVESAEVHNFNTNFINGKEVKDLLRVNMQEEDFIPELIINGNLLVQGLQVKGTLNSLIFNSTNILLKETDQFFAGNLNVQSANVDNIEAKFLNNLNMNELPVETPQTVRISEIDTLKVKNLIVSGYMNNLDLPTLNKYALKTTGNQEITGEYIFDELIFNDLQTSKLNNFSIPEDLVQTTSGEYFIQQDVQLSNDLQARNLFVTSNLNNIIVNSDGTLDVLLKNSSKMQFIEGDKSFKDVELLKPVSLQGKINSESLEDLNPVTKINEPLELVGDYSITGTVIIEKSLETTDMLTEDQEFTISNLQSNGLKLTDEEIPVRLNFAQQLNTGEIFVDKINGIDTRKLVVNGNTETQYIKGWKTFQGDLTITGSTNTHIVNTIDLAKLDMDTLKIDGDQIISGKHEFKNIVGGTITSPHLSLKSEKPLEMMLTNNIKQEITNAFIGELSIDNLECANIHVEKNFNGVNFVDMLEDTLFKGQSVHVTGVKHFENLTVEHLLSRKEINMNRIPTLIKRQEVTISQEGFLELPEGINIENIKFSRMLNNLPAESFEKNWFDANEIGPQTIPGDQFFEKVEVFGNLAIDTNRINDLNLRHLVEDTVKANEEFAFEKVTFLQDVTSLKQISLLGHIENLDIDNIVADNGSEITVDALKFKESVTILSPTKIHTINNVNFQELCEFASPREDEPHKHLIIDGQASILKKPMIKKLNGNDLQAISNAVWFNDIATNITTNLKVAQINFLEELTVDGYVDETDLVWLKDNYFSKTLDQTITSAINFQEGFTAKSIKAPSAQVQSVNDINLDEFARTAILQGWDQTFEQVFFIESIVLNNIEGDYMVNDMNLLTDVMRYDGENIVTGKMQIEDVDVETLNTERDFKVQNADLKLWTQNGVLRTGSYKVDGRHSFGNFTIFEKGLGLTGLLNHNQFTEDKIMLKSKPQTVTGRKVFLGVPEGQNSLQIKNLKLKGTLNDVQFSELVQNQALKHTDNTFTNQVDFDSKIVAQNVNFEGLFQGVNVSQLLHNLTTSAFVENYYEKFVELKEAAEAVKRSLHRQANYFNHFRTMQSFETLIDLVPLKSIQGSLHLATLRTVNHTFILDFFKWSANPGQFNIDTTMAEIKFRETITNWAPLEYDFGSYLYIEIDYFDNAGNTRMGNVLSNNNTAHYEIISYIPNNGTKSVLPIFLPKVQKTCLLLVHSYINFMDIYCQGEHIMELHQRLPIKNALHVETATWDDSFEIIAIEKGEMLYEEHHGQKNREYPSVVVWSYDHNTELFNVNQRIYTSTPISISTASHNGQQYLAIASGHLVNTMYSGQVDIKKYDPLKKRYVEWQVFRASAPLQVQLSVLPSNELLLYVLRNNPSETLMVYQYAGIGKFEYVGVISTLENCNAILPFTDKHLSEHFIITKCNGQFDIIQTIFKS